MPEHLLHTLVETFDVLIGFVGKGVAGRSPPDELLIVGIEQIDNQGSDIVVLHCGR